MGNAKDRSGESYVIYGGASLPATIDLAIAGTANITLYGVDVNDESGISVASAGDVNGDGFDDLLNGSAQGGGALNAKTQSGESYLIFGGATLPATIDLGNLGTAGITIFGEDAFDFSGYPVVGGGDVNGDGFDDILIAADTADGVGNAKSNSGQT